MAKRREYQSEELLHVRLTRPLAFINAPPSEPRTVLIKWRTKMVGRDVLDGLRKGKKQLYALNVQYVKRYCSGCCKCRATLDLPCKCPSNTLPLSERTI